MNTPFSRNTHAYENCSYPWDGTYGRKVEYGKGLCPVAEEVEASAWRAPISEFMTDQDVNDIAAAIRKVAEHFACKQ